MSNTIERPRTDKITEPSKRWRNKYRALRPYRNQHQERRLPGQVYFASLTWPSKEIAETKATCGYRSSVVLGYSEYLGAFPVTP